MSALQVVDSRLVNQSERQNAIRSRLDALGACSYPDLAKLLGVSEMTIRRDVEVLSKRGELIKTFGGVQSIRGPKHYYESPLQQRLSLHRQEKEVIAREAIELVKPQQTVFLDGSTTCLVLARQLAAKGHRLTVVTHSALACMELGASAEHTTVGLGGQFDPASSCFVGPAAEEMAGRFFVDVAFFSTKGFLPEEGTFESAIATFRIKQITAKQAARSILLVDHSKFGQRALCKALDISQIHEVVTDEGAPADALKQLEDRGVKVHVACGDPSLLGGKPHAS